MAVEQWRVVSYDTGYKRIYSKEAPARRKYGEFVKWILADEEGKARLFYRSNIDKNWIAIEEFIFSDEEEEEEED